MALGVSPLVPALPSYQALVQGDARFLYKGLNDLARAARTIMSAPDAHSQAVRSIARRLHPERFGERVAAALAAIEKEPGE
jgi:hypothetical protein